MIALALLSLLTGAQARFLWLDPADPLYAKRTRSVGHEHPQAVTDLSSVANCVPPGQCATLAGTCISSLLAAAAECAQQDCADQMVDLAFNQTDATAKEQILQAALDFRVAEKNTQPIFTTNPPTGRNSVFCQTAPRNAELKGLNQGQDPANDPTLFVDPAVSTNGSTVLLGTAANTVPIDGAKSTVGDATPAAPSAASFLNGAGGGGKAAAAGAGKTCSAKRRRRVVRML